MVAFSHNLKTSSRQLCAGINVRQSFYRFMLLFYHTRFLIYMNIVLNLCVRVSELSFFVAVARKAQLLYSLETSFLPHDRRRRADRENKKKIEMSARAKKRKRKREIYLLCARARVCACACMCVYIPACTHTFLRNRKCVHIHTHIYIQYASRYMYVS